MNTDTIAECMSLSFSNMPFPAVVQRLVGAGVRSYTADLVSLRNTYYGPRGESHDEPLPLGKSPSIATAFNAARVVASVKAIQNSEIGYKQFLCSIMGAGCSHYEVFIGGRKVMYSAATATSISNIFRRKTRSAQRDQSAAAVPR